MRRVKNVLGFFGKPFDSFSYMKNISSVSVASALLAAPFLCGQLAAQTTPPADDTAPRAAHEEKVPEQTPEPEGLLPFFRGIQLLMPMTVSGIYRAPSDIQDTNGQMRSWSMGANLATRHMSEAGIFYGSLDYRYTDYKFSGVTAPFSDTERVLAYVRYERGLSAEWGVFVDASGGFAAEKDAHLQDGASGRFGGGVRYVVSPDLVLYAGAQVMTRLSDNASVFPFIGLSWKIDQHWSLNASNGLVLSYDVFADSSLRLNLGCSYTSSTFRMVDDTWGGVARSRALEVQEVPLSLSVTQELGRSSYVRASVAGLLYSKYKFRSGGAGAGEFKSDPAVMFGLEAGVRF